VSVEDGTGKGRLCALLDTTEKLQTLASSKDLFHIRFAFHLYRFFFDWDFFLFEPKGLYINQKVYIYPRSLRICYKPKLL
jgi:hypothetical protein